MDASPAFMEYRSVKKDRGSNRRLFGPEKHAAVEGGLALLRIPCCTGKLKNLGEGKKRQFL